MRTEVVVTGLGALTPLGGDVASTWAGLLAGQSGITALTSPEFADLPVRIGGRLPVDPAQALPRATARKLDRNQQMLLLAARQAWTDSGLAHLAGTGQAVPGERLAVSVSAGSGGLLSVLETWETLKEKGARMVSPFTVARFIADGAASWIGLEIGAKAALETPIAACATGSEALRRGAELIRAGRADVVVAGGGDASVHPFLLASFAAMRALSHRNDEPARAARPFDKTRDGLVLSEGAAVMVLESAEHARQRGARVYAELAGAGVSADSYDFAQPDPTGEGQAAAMRRALTDARLAPDQVVHINAHAAGTPVGDRLESVAIRRTLGHHTSDAVVTAPKSMMGHLLGGAGAAEALATVLALHHRVVPPTINIDDFDDEIALDVAREPHELSGGVVGALTNSFGLGGHNSVLAFRSVGAT